MLWRALKRGTYPPFQGQFPMWKQVGFHQFRVSFGMVTVSGNTIVIDIMPSSRRGEGLGYYGLANNIVQVSVWK